MINHLKFDNGAKIRWCYGHLETLTLQDGNSRKTPIEPLPFSIEVCVPKGPYSVYGGLEAIQRDDYDGIFVDLSPNTPITTGNTLVGARDDVYFGMPTEIREALEQLGNGTSRTFPFKITNALSGMAGTSQKIFEVLLNVVVAAKACFPDATEVNTAIVGELKKTGVINNDVKIEVT
jgi:hypothetical protein